MQREGRIDPTFFTCASAGLDSHPFVQSSHLFVQRETIVFKWIFSFTKQTRRPQTGVESGPLGQQP